MFGRRRGGGGWHTTLPAEILADGQTIRPALTFSGDLLKSLPEHDLVRGPVFSYEALF